MKPTLRTEKQIMNYWKNTKPVVSICCLTYNHEQFIEDTIKGFLIQETNFPFEVLIHDDASTDNTANIIRSYAKMYPHIIKPIYQKINQFSNGGNITIRFQYPRIKGEYIAICEGDDYWIDEHKLLNSVEFLENHKDYVACFHDVYVVDGNNRQQKESPFSRYKGDISTIKDQIYYNNIPSLSLVYRKGFCKNEIQLIQQLNKGCNFVGDIQKKCLLLKYGKIKYLNQKMGVYRWNRNGGDSYSSQKLVLQLSDCLQAYKNVESLLFPNNKTLKIYCYCMQIRIDLLNGNYKNIISTIYILFKDKILLSSILFVFIKYYKKYYNNNL